jgi:hypothetical protein
LPTPGLWRGQPIDVSEDNDRSEVAEASTPGAKRKHAKQPARPRRAPRAPAEPADDKDDNGSDDDGDTSRVPEQVAEEETPPSKKFPMRHPRPSIHLKRTSTAATLAPPPTPPSFPHKSAEEIEEDQQWGEAMTRFPFTALPDLPKHPGGGPGLYVLDQASRGLIPRTLLHDSEAAAAALDDLFHDTSE